MFPPGEGRGNIFIHLYHSGRVWTALSLMNKTIQDDLSPSVEHNGGKNHGPKDNSLHERAYAHQVHAVPRAVVVATAKALCLIPPLEVARDHEADFKMQVRAIRRDHVAARTVAHGAERLPARHRRAFAHEREQRAFQDVAGAQPVP